MQTTLLLATVVLAASATSAPPSKTPLITPPSASSRRVDPPNHDPSTLIAAWNLTQQGDIENGYPYQIPADTTADWKVYDFYVNWAPFRDSLPSNIQILMNRIGDQGDPDVYLWKATNGSSESFLASDTNTNVQGRHSINYPLDWTAADENVHFKVGVYAWGSSSANFTLALFTTLCPTSVNVGLEPDSGDEKLYLKVCGNPYEPVPTDPAHGTCMPALVNINNTYSAGFCECFSDTLLGTFVGDGCTGIADPVPIYPPPTPDLHHYDFLHVNQGFDRYYNITVSDATYELTVDMVVDTTVTSTLAQMSISVDRYAEGDITSTDFYPSWQMQRSSEQQIKLTRADTADNDMQRIETNGNYIIRVMWVWNATLEHNATEYFGTYFALKVTENQCPNQCGRVRTNAAEPPCDSSYFVTGGTCNETSHTCTCNDGFFGSDCSQILTPLKPTLTSVIGETTQTGVQVSSILTGGAHAVYKLDTSSILGFLKGPAEFETTVVAQHDPSSSQGAFYWCNSVPIITVQSGSAYIPETNAVMGDCKWQQEENSTKTWTEKSTLCASQFSVDDVHKEWFVTVQAQGYADMPFSLSTVVAKQPSAAEYKSVIDTVKAWHDKYNNESAYDGDLAKSLQQAMQNAVVCENNLAECTAQNCGYVQKGDSGVSGGAVAGISILVFVLGGLAAFAVCKFTPIGSILVGGQKAPLKLGGDGGHSLLDPYPSVPVGSADTNPLTRARGDSTL